MDRIYSVARKAWVWLTRPPPGNPRRMPPIPHDANTEGLGWAGSRPLRRSEPLARPLPRSDAGQDITMVNVGSGADIVMRNVHQGDLGKLQAGAPSPVDGKR